eukprot:287172-Chlamydomonas_euryale.AAC.1
MCIRDRPQTGRVRGAMGADRAVEAAKEARLKGPHPFPLQRLLTCAAYLQSGREAREVGTAGDDG